MQRLFRPNRSDPNSLVETPFYDFRPLTHREFKSCAEMYMLARQREYRDRLLQPRKHTDSDSRAKERWPDLASFDLTPQDYWNIERALGRLYFAQTGKQQRQARQEARQLAQRGPIPLRQAIAEAVLATPQTQRRFTVHDIIFQLFSYRAERQFVWRFLRHESELDRKDLKDSRAVERAAKILSEAYSYLHLKPAEIVQGLPYSHQADRDTAEEFVLSEMSVRSLFSKFARPRT